MNLLVTAGPTHEYIDAVRFIGNASSGKMGFAVAQTAQRAGHRVTLISGPTALKPPKGVHFVAVTSAREMKCAIEQVYSKTDALVMTAAVSDYRPTQRFRGKLKKSAQALTLTLAPTPDILAGLARKKGKRIHIGFALETQNVVPNALKKLRKKKLDYIVLNTPAAIGAGKLDATLFSRTHERQTFHSITKDALARKLVRVLEKAVSTGRALL